LLTLPSGGSGLAIYALALAAGWASWRENLFNLLVKCRQEIHRQLGRDE
jgi:hypothetical protein